MPGLPANTNNQMAIVPQPAEPVAQPRQPENLQGLLRFAMQAQGAAAAPPPRQEAPQPLDDERKEFLQNALKSMTVDVIELMKKQIETLQNVNDISEDEVETKLVAFAQILEFTTNIDLANDFHKINGFSILEPSLKCKHHEIRASACELIAELSQNNPYIQSTICETTDLMALLLHILDNDEVDQVQIKALYAISCITRDSDIGYKNFKHHNGLPVLKKVLVKDNDKIRTKITFLLTALNRLDDDLIKNLISLNFLPILIKLIEGDWRGSHEHVLSLLNLILEKDPSARAEIKKPEYNLKVVIDKHLDIVLGKDEYQEEQFYCQQILKLVYN